MTRYLKQVAIVLALLLTYNTVSAQTSSATDLFYKLRSKLQSVQDYVADVKMKIDISFLRIPTLYGKLYFKNPDKMKLERNGGISILPKKSISLTLNNLVPAGNATVIDAGTEVINGKKLRVIKVVPDNDKTDIVLTKIWVDEERALALRTETTTRDNGTVSMDLRFGRYANLALPDQVTFYLDVKEFKVPKGVAMDYDAGDKEMLEKRANTKSKKGTIQITYLNYKINTGLSDNIFREEKK
jgi:outer membrane lipoprotein-sorting protein